MNENKTFVNLNNARFDDQRRVMEDIDHNQECPFCPENLSKYHKEEIIKKGVHWILTKNQWPYKNTEVHLLAIAAYHAEKISDLKPGSFDELQDYMTWAESEYKVSSGGIAMRFGDMQRNGGSVRHLHVHFIVPSFEDPNREKIRFNIG